MLHEYSKELKDKVRKELIELLDSQSLLLTFESRGTC